MKPNKPTGSEQQVRVGGVRPAALPVLEQLAQHLAGQLAHRPAGAGQVQPPAGEVGVVELQRPDRAWPGCVHGGQDQAEACLRGGRRGDRVGELITRSAAPLAALVRVVARLLGAEDNNPTAAACHVESAAGLEPGTLVEVALLADGRSLSPDAARALFPRYLRAVDTLADAIDRWHIA